MSYTQMRMLSLSPWLGITVLIAVALLLAASSRSFLDVSVWGGDGEFEVLPRAPSKGPGKPPIIAYWISGTGGDGGRVLRLSKAVYHPRNRYLLHLDAGSTPAERIELARAVQSEGAFKAFGNVDVIGKAYPVDRTAASAVAAVLHGAAVLLKVCEDWDWFITLSASDYPLVTQDDLLHVFSSVPRHLNFIDHTSDLGWKEVGRFDKITVDQSLYMEKNTRLFFGTESRATPDAFKLFTGSPWVIITRHFVEYCVHGWDSIPRKLLMYFTNVPYPVEAYFQTVICNAPEFRNTTVNGDLRYFRWDDPPKLEPIFLNRSHYKPMTRSGAAFARKFVEGDAVLRKLDDAVLGRAPDGLARGRWCSGEGEDPCSSWGGVDEVRPGKQGKRMKRLVSEMVSGERLRSNQCKS